jgi:hypothetical protein
MVTPRRLQTERAIDTLKEEIRQLQAAIVRQQQATAAYQQPPADGRRVFAYVLRDSSRGTSLNVDWMTRLFPNKDFDFPPTAEKDGHLAHVMDPTLAALKAQEQKLSGPLRERYSHYCAEWQVITQASGRRYARDERCS